MKNYEHIKDQSWSWVNFEKVSNLWKTAGFVVWIGKAQIMVSSTTNGKPTNGIGYSTVRNQWTDYWMNEWMNEWINEWMNRWMDEMIKYNLSCN